MHVAKYFMWELNLTGFPCLNREDGGKAFWDGGWGKGWIKGLPAFLPALPAPHLNPRGASLSPPPMPSPPPPPPVSASTLVWDDIRQFLLERYSDVAKQIRTFELFWENMWNFKHLAKMCLLAGWKGKVMHSEREKEGRNGRRVC